MSRQLSPRPTSATMGMREGGGGFHFGFDQVLHFFGFFGDDVEEEFVVDLEGHEGL